MNRLPYQLPKEWCRIIFSSEKIKNKWKPRIQNCSTAFSEFESRSVLGGLRSSALISVSSDSLVESVKMYGKQGLVLLPVDRLSQTGTYSSSGNVYKIGDPFSYRCVLTRPEFVSEWLEATSQENNHRMIGKLLGFPPCCVDFFQKTWIDEQYLDTSYPMFENSNNNSDGPYHNNILLRWVGVRFLSHLPCSFSCEASALIGKQNEDFMRNEMKIGLVLDDMINLLNMSVEWSAKHGIAEIKTPLFKVSTRTDATGELYKIQKPGSWYPDEDVSGTNFPYRNKQKNQITQGKSFKRSLQVLDNPTDSSVWEDNGFSSAEGMYAAHSSLKSSISKMVNLNLIDSIVDLGCGNGEFLNSMSTLLKKPSRMAGVEINTNVAKKAQFKNSALFIFNEDIFSTSSNWPSMNYRLGIISSNRFYEAFQVGKGNVSYQELLELIHKSVETLIIYDYGDAKLSSTSLSYILKEFSPYKTMKTENNVFCLTDFN